jgi:hypothetical protein
MPRWLVSLAVVLTHAVVGAGLGFAAGVAYPLLITRLAPGGSAFLGAAAGALLGLTLGWLRHAERRAAL